MKDDLFLVLKMGINAPNRNEENVYFLNFYSLRSLRRLAVSECPRRHIVSHLTTEQHRVGAIRFSVDRR